MNINKVILIFLMLFGMIAGVSAIDYDNISFTNQEFYNGVITATKTIQINTSHLGVGYIASGTLYYNYCLLDGTNCGTATALASSVVSFDMFLDTTNNNVIMPYGKTTGSGTLIRNLDGSYAITGLAFNSGSTNYISAVQTSSTEFAIAYSDTSTSSTGRGIICKLDGSSCATEVTIRNAVTSYNKVILDSGNKLNYIYQSGTSGLISTRCDTDNTNCILAPAFYNTGTNSYIDMIEGSDNKLKIVYTDLGNSNYGTFRSCDLDGTNCGSEIVFNSENVAYNSLKEFDTRLFVANTVEKLTNFDLIGNDILTGSIFSTNATLYTSLLITSNKNAIISYKDVSSNKGMFAISEPFTTGAVVTINSPLDTTYINTNPFNLNITTDLNTNLTYSLNGGSNISLGNNINSSSSSITGTQGSNTIIVYSNYSGEVSSETSTFTIDTINPVITNNIPLEINSYEFLDTYFSCSDTNLLSCNISIDSLNKESETNFSLTNNGNLSYTITSEDLAGNIVTDTGILFVNPYQYFYFTYINNTPITSFIFNSVTYTDYAAIKTYDVGLGNQTLVFEKLGFATTNISIEFTSTSNINLTTNITNSQIQVMIYDRETEALLTGLSTITLVATVGFNTTTTTGQVNISNINFLSEQYQLIVSHDGYVSESIIFNYDNQETLPINVYLLNATSVNYGIVIVEVTADTGQLVSNAVCKALEWRPSLSAFISVAEGLSNSNGQVLLNIELAKKLYKFSCSKAGFEILSSQQIIYTTNTIVPLELKSSTSTEFDIYSTLSHSLINTVFNSTHDTITFTWSETNGLASQGCVKLFNVKGTNREQIGTDNCALGSTGQITFITSTNNTFTKLIEASILDINNRVIFVDSIVYKNNSDISVSLAEYNLDIILPLVFILIAIAIGLILSPQNIYISEIAVIILVWVSVGIVPTLVSTTIAASITVIAGLMLWGGYKTK